MTADDAGFVPEEARRTVHTQYFGPRWDAPQLDDAELIATPVGERCLDCDELIVEGDQGFMRMAIVSGPQVGKLVGSYVAVHRECELAGTVSHLARACRCFEPELGIRESGRRTLAWIEAAGR